MATQEPKKAAPSKSASPASAGKPAAKAPAKTAPATKAPAKTAPAKKAAARPRSTKQPFQPWTRTWWSKRRKAKKARLAKMTRAHRIWRRLGIAFTWMLTLLAITMVVTVYAFYRLADVPSPSDLRADQVSVLEFADGTEIGRIGNVNRTDVPLSAVPESLKWAVLSTEDRNFYTNPGFSISGTMRAAWNDVTGGERQGGSGITQQYVKNAYLSDEQSISRKLRELAIAVKLDREYSKDQILEWYLNTVYFGRGAYGVQAAAQTYFGVDVAQLSVAQSAVITALLKAPSIYDPGIDIAAAQARWGIVLDAMVDTKHLSAADRAAQVFPETRPVDAPNGLGITGTNGYLVAQVTNELLANGFTQDELDRGGLRIRTTIDPKAQAASVTAIQEIYADQPANLRQALVAIDPASGGVLAYYGGTDGTGFDYAQAYRQPGSSFKPFVLATALQQNLAGGSPDGTSYTVNSTFNGSSPRTIDGQLVHNSDGESCGSCSLATSMKLSINTVFYDLTSRIGPTNVAATAQAMGVSPVNVATGEPTLQIAGGTDSRISIGGYEVRTIDQASGFATLAAGGVHRPAHFVTSVTTADGTLRYQAADGAKQVIDPKVANDVTMTMRPIASYSNDGLAGSRQSAAKTGTVGIENSNDNSDSWMVGFTPQVSAAVWTGSDTLEPTYNAGGAPLYGSMLSGKAWKLFMDTYLADAPKLPITATAQIGVTSSSAPPSTTPTPTPTPEAPTPTPTPTVEPTPTPTPTPEAPSPTPTPTVTPTPEAPSSTPTPTSTDPVPAGSTPVAAASAA